MNVKNRYRHIVSGIISRTKRIAPETALVSAFLAIFVVSTGFLSWKIDRDLDPDHGKEYWIIALEKRGGLSDGFFIENHSDEGEFTYTVSGGGENIASGMIGIARGEKRVVDLSAPDISGRITVTVEDGQGGKKSIYLER